MAKQNPIYTVSEETTLLPFLLLSVKGKSRNNIKSMLTRGQIVVDGKSVTNHATPLHAGQVVEVRLNVTVGAPPMLPILYEDDDLIAVNKPAGMLAISTDKERERTAYHIVFDYMKAKKDGGRVFVVHRLDRETSGVMLLAKNEQVKRRLQDSWDESVRRRGYIAVVEGCPEPQERTIRSWLRETKTLLVYSSHTEGDGKLAVTSYTTLRTTAKNTMLDISLDTGRKNQIRVHMKDIGHPIVGDKKYDAKTDPLKRLALHASVLTLLHPITGDELRLVAPIPPQFVSFMARNV